MTTTENGIQVKLFVEEGIYLLEMTTTENKKKLIDVRYLPA